MRQLISVPLACVVVLGALALPVASEARAAADELTVEDLAERLAGLQRAAGDLEASQRGEDGRPVGERAEDLVERLLALRNEIDEILALLAAQPAPVEDEIAAEAGVAERATEALTEKSVIAADRVAEQSAEVTTTETVPQPATEPAEARCAEFAVFDSNEDGVVSGLDRYWRYFRLWRDDGDGAIEDHELSRLYDVGVREVTAALGTYRTVDGDAGDVRGDGGIRLEMSSKRGGTVALAIDADRLARGGELELRDGAGVALHGMQALTSAMVVFVVDGTPVPLSCG